jgi:hypothetical protein
MNDKYQLGNRALDDPQRHDYEPPCGSDEGRDACWYCGYPKRFHAKKKCSDPGCEQVATVGDTCGLHPHITFKEKADA